MRDVTLGGLRVRITDGDDGGPLIVLLHGFGAPGDDLVPLVNVFDVPPGTRFAFPEAPLDLPPSFGIGGARAWWMIDFEKLEQAMSGAGPRDIAGEQPDGLPGARSLVIAMLEALQEEVGAPPERTVLGGFSQGAMLSCDVALHTDRPFAGLVRMPEIGTSGSVGAPGAARGNPTTARVAYRRASLNWPRYRRSRRSSWSFLPAFS